MAVRSPAGTGRRTPKAARPRGTFVIDALPESAPRYRDTHAIVVADVFRATTTIVTALDCGHPVYPASDVEEAMQVAGRLNNPILAGEQAGVMPAGFDIQNSPVEVRALARDGRPLVVLTSAGTLLLGNCRGAEAIYCVSLRNLTATAEYVAREHLRVALIGAGTRGRERAEDQIACSWVGRRLIELGFEPENATTVDQLRRWPRIDPQGIACSESCTYLIQTAQEHDIQFVLAHIDDVDAVVAYDGFQAHRLPVAVRQIASLGATPA